METLYFRICVVLGLLAGAVIVALPLRRQFADFHEFVRRTPKWQRAFLALLAAVFIAYGSTKTNRVNQVEGGRLKVEQWNLPTCSAGQPEQGFNLLCSTSTLGFDYLPHPSAGRLPVGAILATNWWRRGCWEDCRKIEFADGWVFPFGTNHFSSVVVMSQGGVRTGFCDASEIAALGTKVALVPFDSCFCHEHTPSNSYRFAWDRAYVGRDTNTPMTASIELFRTGDVCVTTNGVPTVEPYVIPFPHVGVGQNDDWVRTNFLNAAEILSAGYADWVDAKVGVDLDNGLYKFTATFPVDPPEATELFVGDLSVCVTNAGEYVFLLEKGVEYSFGTNPFDATVDYSMQDDLVPPAPLFASWWGGDDNGVWTVDGGECELWWPTLFGYGTCLWEPTFFGSPDVAGLAASDFPMTFTAVFLDCCRTNGATYHWTSPDERVNILSPNAQTTEVEIDSSLSGNDLELSVEAYTQDRNYYSTLRYHIPTNDARGLSLSMPDVFFVNNDDDNDDGALDCDQRIPSGNPLVRDDDIVGVTVGLPDGESRNGTLLLQDNDGFAGWIYDAAIQNDYVGLGSDWELTSQSVSELPLEMSASRPSDGYRSSLLKFRWSPDNGSDQTVYRRFTVVEPIVEPICSERKSVSRDGVEHLLVYNPSGVVIGKDAYFKITVKPDDYPDSKIRWSAVGDGAVAFVGGDTGREVCVRGVSEGDVNLEIDIGGCSAAKLTFPVKVVENVPVKLSVCILSDGNGPMRAESEIREMLPEVNDIFEQVGMTFYIDLVVVTNVDGACRPMFYGGSTAQHWGFDDVANILPDAGGLKCYFIDSFFDSDKALGGNDGCGLLLTRRAQSVTWAHEIGHACGLDDIYYDRSGEYVPVTNSFEWRHAPDDWNNGSYGMHTKGSRYYRKGMKHVDAIMTLLMYGYSKPQALDISAGAVEGIVKIDEETAIVGDARTGMFASGAIRTPEHRRKEPHDE